MKEIDLKKARRIRIILFILIILFLIGLTIYLYPFVLKLKDKEYFDYVISKLKGMGFLGALLLILANIIQVILAIIPGEIVEIASGIMYGPWLGLLICEIGITIGCFIVCYLVKKFGRGFANLFVNIDEVLEKRDLLKNEKRTEIFIASLLLFPGLPKDFIAFVIPFTKVSIEKFLIINAIARIPSILTSTFFGGSLFTDHLKLAIIIYSVEALLAVLGFIFNKKITERLENKEYKLDK